jgi:hypothetical protein
VSFHGRLAAPSAAAAQPALKSTLTPQAIRIHTTAIVAALGAPARFRRGVRGAGSPSMMH